MRIRVNGKQIDVGDALTTHCQDRVGDVVNKYAEKPVEHHVFQGPARVRFGYFGASIDGFDNAGAW
jgi:ribosome-associated translation inhibitor RaiA